MYIKQTLKIVLFLCLMYLPYSGHAKNYSILDGSKSKASDTNNYDVYIVSIDGKQQFDQQKITLDSGLYSVNLASSKTRKLSRSGRVSYQSFSLNLKPCIRYLLSAQYQSSSAKIYDWELKVEEQEIEGCEILEEETTFSAENDPRTDNFQAEIYAISLYNYLTSKQSACSNLKSHHIINDWIHYNNDQFVGSYYQIQKLIAYKMLVSNENTVRDLFKAIQARIYQGTLDIETQLSTENDCELSLENLAHLDTIDPFDKVYSSFEKPYTLTDKEQKHWNEAMLLLNESSSQ